MAENATAHLSIKDYNIIVTHTELEFPASLIFFKQELNQFLLFLSLPKNAKQANTDKKLKLTKKKFRTVFQLVFVY